MVRPATALGRSGLHDWFIQRLSAVVLAAFVITLMGWAMTHDISFLSWRELFAQNCMKIFSLLTMLALAAHAWIGMWTIMTDYVKPTGIRLVAQSVIILVTLSVLLWGVSILWSV